MQMPILTVAHLLRALREVKDRYQWSLDGGTISGRLSARARRGIEPIVAIMRVVHNRPGLRSSRMRGMSCFPLDPNNFRDFTRACKRPGRRQHSPRQKWIRKLVSRELGLEPNDD